MARVLCLLLTLPLSLSTSLSTSLADDVRREAQSEPAATEPLSLVVMDPLAAPLSCPCVEGYAQRKYEVLAEHLEKTLDRKVKLTFDGSLRLALKKTGGTADIVIGKDSVVRSDAKAAKLPVTAVGRLTDRQGSTEQFGMIVVNKEDPAETVADLQGYTIIFGPAEAEEKHDAALELLHQSGIDIPKANRKIDLACSDGACKVIDMGPKSKTAAVISSYAQPLLEGCGTIKKGDLKVVAKTDRVPFVTAFVADSLGTDQRKKIEASLSSIALEPTVLEALESLVGFLPVDTPPKQASTSTAKKK